MTELARLKFYATQAHSCSYLPEEQATTLFLDPSQPMDVHVYADLSEMGFRRSGDHLYRPHCQNCNACVPARIPVAQFLPNRNQKRIFKRNADLTVNADQTAIQRRILRPLPALHRTAPCRWRYVPAQPRPVFDVPGTRPALLALLRVPPRRSAAGRGRDRPAAQRPVGGLHLLRAGRRAPQPGTLRHPLANRRSPAAGNWRRCTSDTGSRTAKR